MMGDNVTRDDYLFFKGQMERDEERLKSARDQRKKTRSRAKLLGIDLEVMDWTRALANEDDETSLARFQTLARYAQFQALPLGHQLSFLIDGDGRTLSEDDYQRAHRQGYELGIQGKDPDEQAYPPMTPEGQEHRAGWNAGQDEQKRRFLAMNEEGAEPPKPEGKKRGRPSKAELAARAKAAEAVH